MFVTRHTHVVDAVLADKLWQLYDVAYQGLSEQAVTREMPVSYTHLTLPTSDLV